MRWIVLARDDGAGYGDGGGDLEVDVVDEDRAENDWRPGLWNALGCDISEPFIREVPFP